MTEDHPVDPAVPPAAPSAAAPSAAAAPPATAYSAAAPAAGAAPIAEAPAATAAAPRARAFPADAFTGSAVGRALAVAAVLVVATVVTAVAAALLVLIGAALTPHASSGATSSPLGGAVPQIQVSGFPLLSALMAVAGSILFGTISGSASVTASSPLAILGVSGADAHYTLYLPMIGLLAPVVLLTVWAAFTLTPAAAPPIRVRLLHGGITAVAALAAMEVLALAGTSSVTVSGLAISSTPASWSLALGTAAVAFGASLAGTSLAARAGRRTPLAFLRGLGGLPRRLPVWAGVPLVPFLVWSICFAVTAFIGILIAAIGQGSPVLGFSAPVLTGTVAVLAAGLGQLGAVSTSAGATVAGRDVGQTQLGSVFSSGSPWPWLVVVVALLATVASAFALHRLRPAGERRPIWLLPAAAVAGWLVLPPLVAVIRGGGDVAVSTFTGTGAISVGLAWWVCLLAGVWALGIEALARWVVPAWTDRRAEGGRVRLLSLIGAAAVLAVLVLSVAVTALLGVLLSPAGAARAYLAALQDGDTKTATAVAGTGTVPALPARSSDRISAVQVGNVTTSGSTATAAVGYTLAGKHYDRTLSLTQDGTTAGIFPRWVVAQPLLTTISMQNTLTDAVQLGGRDVQSSSGYASVRVLPGVYAPTAKGQAAKYVSFSTTRVVAGGVVGTSVTQEATSALADGIAARVRSALAACAASTQAAPTGCPFSTYVFGDYRNLTWSVTTQPTVQLSGYGTSWTASGGVAQAAYEERGFFDSTYTAKTETVTMYPLYGTAKVTATGVTVTSG